MIPPVGPRTRSQRLLEEPVIDSRRVSFGKGRGTLSSNTLVDPGTNVEQRPLGERTQTPRSGVTPVPPGETTQIHPGLNQQRLLEERSQIPRSSLMPVPQGETTQSYPGQNQQGSTVVTQLPRSSLMLVPQGESTQLNTALGQQSSTGNTQLVQNSQRISIGTNPGTSGTASAPVNSRTSRYKVARKFPTCLPEHVINQGNKSHNSEIDTRLDPPKFGPERGNSDNKSVTDNSEINTRLDTPTLGPERGKANKMLISDNCKSDTRLDIPTLGPERGKANKMLISDNCKSDTRLDTPTLGPERGKANKMLISDNCKNDTRLDIPTPGPERDKTSNMFVSHDVDKDTRLDTPTCGPGRRKSNNLFDSDSENNIQGTQRGKPPCPKEVLRVIALLEDPPSDLSDDVLHPCIFDLQQQTDDNSEPEQASDSEWEDEVETLCEPAVSQPAVPTKAYKTSQASKHPKNFSDWKILEDHLYYRRPDPLKEILEWAKRVQRLDELRHKVESVMRKENERQEKYHGTDLKIPEVAVGDKVYYPNRKLSNKAAGYSASLGSVISPLVVELKNERGKLLGQHYIPDSKLPRHSDRVMWRISQEIKNRRESRQRPDAAQVNTGGVKPGINSGAVQRALLAELPSEAAVTPRTSVLSRLGPMEPSYDPSPAVLTSSVFDRLGALQIGDGPKETEDGKHSAPDRARTRRANRRHGRGHKICTEISKWCGLSGNQNRLNRRRSKFNLLLADPTTPKNILWKA
ncbi:Protein of unknown function, partial [Cotesia congregata]